MRIIAPYADPMASASSVATAVASVRKALLRESESGHWTSAERVLISGFAAQLDGLDRAAVVYHYLELVRSLGKPSGQDRILVLTEGGGLIQQLDPRAYDAVAAGVVLDPVEFVQRRLRNQAIVRRLDAWVQAIPDRLCSLRLDQRQAGPDAGADFRAALVEFVNEARRTQAVPPVIGDVCNAIILKQTSVTRVTHADLFAFFWPATLPTYRDRLTSGEALRLLKSMLINISPRKLADRAKERPAIKDGTHYVKKELLAAANDGFFAHRNKKY